MVCRAGEKGRTLTSDSSNDREKETFWDRNWAIAAIGRKLSLGCRAGKEKKEKKPLNQDYEEEMKKKIP